MDRDFHSPGETGSSRWLAPALMSLVSAALLFAVVPNQMFQHDEGQYAEGAIRILAGELPHRDFHEPYTGGLAYLNAATFWLCGERLVNLRYVLILAVLPVALVMYDTIRRLHFTPVTAAVVTSCSLLVSVGMTHTAWANLYLSLLTIAATWMLVRDADRPHWSWILGTGCCAGLAILCKITGVYSVAAVGMALTLRGVMVETECCSGSWVASKLWTVVVATLALASTSLLLLRHMSVDAFLFFVVPILCSGVFLIAASQGMHMRRLAASYAQFALGAAIPLTLFAVPWLMAAATDDLFYGVLVRPRIRLVDAHYPPPTAWWTILAAPTLLCFVSGLATHWRVFSLIGLGVMLLFGLLDPAPTAFKAATVLSALSTWRCLLPLLATASVAACLYKRQLGPNELKVFVLLTGAAFCGLNQYPWTQPLYCFFFFPNLILSAVGLCALTGAPEDETEIGKPTRRALSQVSATVATFMICCFCFLRLGADGIFAEFIRPEFKSETRNGQISGIQVPKAAESEYSELKRIFDAALNEEQTILAGPDLPHVYFFCQRRNITPVFYDFMASADRSQHEQMLYEYAARPEVGAIVVNTAPEFSERWSKELLERIASECEAFAKVGQFLVMFKHQPDDGIITSSDLVRHFQPREAVGMVARRDP